MSNRKSIITELNQIQGLKIECPECGETFKAQSAKLFSIKEDLPQNVLRFIKHKNSELNQELIDIKEQRKELRERGKAKPIQIKVTTEAVNFGKIVEKIIPAFKDFPFKARDCRALYEPIDYVVFNNLSKTGVVDSITFADVKSGNARLQDNQQQIKRLVEKGKIKLTVTDYE